MTLDNQPDSEQGVDPKAFQRVKGERDQLANQSKELEGKLSEAQQEVQGSKLVDGLYDHLRTVEEDKVPEALRDGWKSRDFYALARQVAPQVVNQENPGEAAVKWLSDMASLLQPSQTTVRPETPMTQANPSAEGIVVESGPFKVGSPEYNDFAKQHGDAAARQAIADGQFFFSSENLAAQETAYS